MIFNLIANELFTPVALYNVTRIEEADIILIGEVHDHPVMQPLIARLISESAKDRTTALFHESMDSFTSCFAEHPQYDDVFHHFSYIRQRMGLASSLRPIELFMYGWDCPGANYNMPQIWGAVRDIYAEIESAPGNKEPSIQKLEFVKRVKETCTAPQERSFPARTRSMIATIAKVSEMQKRGQLPRRAIFVAGVAHVMTPQNDCRFRGEHFRLETLYAECRKHKVAIIVPTLLKQILE
jgi:hypothetical protein